MTIMRTITISLVFLLGLIAPLHYLVAGQYSYEIESPVQAPENPSLTIVPTSPWTNAKIELKRGAETIATKRVSKLKRGESLKIPIDQSVGESRYRVKLKADVSDKTLNTAFAVTAKKVPKLKIDILQKASNIEAGKLVFRSNRPLERARLRLASSDRGDIKDIERRLGAQKGRIAVEWEESGVDRISLKVWDVDGFWQAYEVKHFWVRIPHREVRFKFGEATWKQTEEEKLKKTMKRVRKELRNRAGNVFDMKLYIAGYTDTVGSKKQNRILSQKRAKAIASWFRNNGLDIPVFYQGFGEEVLKVETEDEVKNKKNRRALYILGSKKPPISDAIPESDWKAIQ